MSGTDSHPAGEQPDRGFNRAVRRFRSVRSSISSLPDIFRTKSSASGHQRSSSEGPSAALGSPVSGQPQLSPPAAAPAATPAAPAAPTAPAAPAAPPARDARPVRVVSSGNARQRSRQVLLKHHLAIDPEWFEAGPDRPDQVQRVEKPIRMRKHRRKHVKGEPGPDVQFVPLVDARAARSRAINEKLGPVIDPWRYMQAEDMNRLVPRVERKPRLRKHPKDAKRSISGHHQKTAKPDSAAQAKHGLQHQQRKPQQQQQQLPRAVRRADLEASRVRLFRERYGLDISDWLSPTDPADTVERIEKAVRMRKRRQAPNTTAAPGTTPHSSALRFDEHHSAHIRLSLDPHGITIDTTVISGGTPRARTIERLENGTWIRTHPPPDDLFPSYRPQPSGGHRPWVDDDNVLHLPSRTGGQDVVRVPPQQRVRRSCHLCHTLFVGRATDCRLCGHARCKRCPREPPKPEKYPEGYPGDALPPRERVYKPIRRRKHPGEPPKRPRTAPNPQVDQRLDERLAATHIAE